MDTHSRAVQVPSTMTCLVVDFLKTSLVSLNLSQHVIPCSFHFSGV